MYFLKILDSNYIFVIFLYVNVKMFWILFNLSLIKCMYDKINIILSIGKKYINVIFFLFVYGWNFLFLFFGFGFGDWGGGIYW